MAKIQPYVAGGSHIGQKINVKVRKVIWLKVGSGAVQAFSDHEVRIAGKINVPGYNGDLTIHLKLMDNAPTADKGSCCLQLNSYLDEEARYEATADLLTVYAVLGGKKQNISIRPIERNTQTECRLFGHVDETVHLDPA